MAMNKKEQAAMKAAIDKAETLAALRWTQRVPRDLPAPSPGWRGDRRSEYVAGWNTNSHTRRVSEAWSTCIAHGDGPIPKEGAYRCGRQGSIALYSTKLLALRGMRHEVERDCALKLLEVDRMIAAAEAEEAAAKESAS